MSDPLQTADTLLPSALALRIDEACDRFEADWKAALSTGQRPHLEQYFAGVPATEAAALVPELILLDVHYRRRAGEQPRTEDYQGRFPTLPLEWLCQAVAVPAAVTATAPPQPPEQRDSADKQPPGEAAQQLRCPHCHNPIQLKDERPDEVLCPACGSSFCVRDARQTTTGAAMRPLGKFQLLERVGVGAFGAVWKARDTELDRIVALKIPHAGLLSSKDDLERFHREARAAAQLRHPGIVTVHEVAILEGLPTLVADFIEGVPLKEFLQARQFTFRETAVVLAEVAEALDYAHEMGLVHRDIKPANIMLEYRESVADQEGRGRGLTVGKPLLMDFGLALRAEAEVTLTIEGQIIGTPAYMSPEQASGQGHQADRRSDVYSLGVVLYELLTGELPFRGSKGMMLLQVLREEPRPPRRVNDKIPRDLETICLKALAKAPAQRYASARGMAEDLRRWLAGEPIQARPVSAWERAWHWARQRPAVAALVFTSGVAALALVGALVSVFYNLKLREAHEHTQSALASESEARKEEKIQRQRAEQQQYYHHIARAQADWRDGNLGAVEQLLDQCPTEQRNWEWRYLKRQCHADLLTLPGHGERVESVAFSPDGTRFASAGVDRLVHVWDAAIGQELLRLKGHTRGVSGVAFSPDGTLLASGQVASSQGTPNGTLLVWDARTGQVFKHLEGGSVWSNPAFSPDGKRLASGGEERGDDGVLALLTLWDTTTWQKTRRILYHQGHVFLRGLAFSPDGARLASAAHDGTVRLWDPTTGALLATLTEHNDKVHSIVFSPDGTRLASGSGDQIVRIWNATTGQALLLCRDHKGDVKRVAYSPDGRWLASASFDRTVKLWDAATGQVIRTFKGHTDPVYGVAFSPDGTRLVSASDDGTVKVWGVTADPEARRLTSPGKVNSVAFSPDGKQLASGGEDGVRLWDAQTGQIRCTWEASGRFFGVAFSPDGKRLAAGGEQILKVWDVTTHQEIHTLTGHTNHIIGVAFSPDGTRLASGSRDKTVKIWNLTTGKEVLTLTGHTGNVESVAFSPDGIRLASSGYLDKTGVRIWDATTGALLHTLQGPTNLFGGVGFSPDWTRLAAAGSGRGTRVTVWDTTTGQLVHELQGHTDMVRQVAFSPDGTRIASTGTDRTVKVWDARTGQELLSLEGHSAYARSVAFSPDGTRLASAGSDGTIKVWDARPWTPAEGRVEPEALDLLASLVAKPLCLADVREYLRSSPTISSQVRQQALTLVEQYHEETDPERYHQAAWAVVRQPYLNTFQYRFALRQAETACRLVPQEGKYRMTLGMAQYRAGQYRQALNTLVEVDQLQEGIPANLAFLAMVQHRLGQKEQAQATLARLRALQAQAGWLQEDEVQHFFQEAEILLRGSAHQPEP